MKIRIYTDSEIAKLKSNMFVRNIHYKRQIEYDPIFKLWTIVLRKDCPHLSAREIFARGGFDVNILHKNLPQKRIKEWYDNYKKFGIKYFLPEDEFYTSIQYKQDDGTPTYDNVKLQILNFVLSRLKEYQNEDR